MIIYFDTKCCLPASDNVDEHSLKLSLTISKAKNEKYNKNININLYGCGTEYG